MLRKAICRGMLEKLVAIEIPLADAGEQLDDVPPQAVEQVVAVPSSSPGCTCSTN